MAALINITMSLHESINSAGLCRDGQPPHQNHPCRQGVHGLLTYCANYHCKHSIAVSGDHWPDDAGLSDIGPLFICAASGKRGADVRPDFKWNKQTVAMMGYR
jgi:hypothetical protein